MDKIEKVARAMCIARGTDPDADSGRGPIGTTRLGRSAMATSYSFGPQPLANWPTCEEEAKVFVAAHAAPANDHD
jgi:hypothetical protein